MIQCFPPTFSVLKLKFLWDTYVGSQRLLFRLRRVRILGLDTWEGLSEGYYVVGLDPSIRLWLRKTSEKTFSQDRRW
jgi:hypothetical protein